jgi:opacity protein-like surface antigen
MITVTLVFGITASSLAAEKGSIYVDTMIGGTVDVPNNLGGDGDAQETYIGFELPVEQFKFNLELQKGTWDQNDSNDFNGYEIKGGYQFLNNHDLKLYATLSDFYRKFDSDQEFSGILLGADAVYALTKEITAEGSLAVSVSGKYREPGYHEDANLLLLKAKLNYLLSQNVYATLGYRYYGANLEDSDVDIKSKGLTFGVNFKF